MQLTQPTTHFDVKHKRTGHLFQGRYKAILVEKPINILRNGLSRMRKWHRWLKK